MKLNEKLVSLRKKNGLTQLKVAEKLNVSRQAISRWESGIAFPSTDNLRCLSELYGVPVDYLLKETTEQIVDQEKRSKLDKEIHVEMKKEKQAIMCVVMIALAVIILVISAFWLRENMLQERDDVNSFSEIGSDSWENKSRNEFTMNW